MSALPSLVDYREPLVVLPEDTQNFSVSCVPTGAGQFGPSSQIQVDLGNRGFLDPASLLFRYKMTYTKVGDVGATSVSVVGTPAYTPFLRLDTIINSQNVESINQYGVVCNMLSNIRLGISEKYGQQSALGYENSAAAPYSMENLDGAVIAVGAGVGNTTVVRSYSAPLYNLLSGSEKLIPLFLLNGVRLQFTLDTASNIQVAGAANPNAITDFAITNFEIVYNMVDFGGAVEREVVAMNPKLRLKTQSYATGTQSLAQNAQGSQSLVYNMRYASCKSAFISAGGGTAATSLNRQFDAYDITSSNGDYCLQIGSQQYPQKPLSTLNNRSGLLQELRRAMNSIFDKNNSMSINSIEFAYGSATATTVPIPAKCFVGINLQKLSVPLKSFFTGVSTQNAPITLVCNLGTQTAQPHNVMLIINYDAIMEIDTSTKQCLLIA